MAISGRRQAWNLTLIRTNTLSRNAGFRPPLPGGGGGVHLKLYTREVRLPAVEAEEELLQNRTTTAREEEEFFARKGRRKGLSTDACRQLVLAVCPFLDLVSGWSDGLHSQGALTAPSWT